MQHRYVIESCRDRIVSCEMKLPQNRAQSAMVAELGAQNFPVNAHIIKSKNTFVDVAAVVAFFFLGPASFSEKDFDSIVRSSGRGGS